MPNSTNTSAKTKQFEINLNTRYLIRKIKIIQKNQITRWTTNNAEFRGKRTFQEINN